MGCTLTTAQHEKVIQGRAICNDRYYEYPEGCAVSCFHGSPKLEHGLSKWQKLPITKQWPKKIEVVQPAVKEMMLRLHAEELYREFMDAVFALIDSGTVWGWRRKLLSIRMQFAPRFFALGIDVWVCKQHTGGQYGHSEYWMLFVDRNVADPASVKKSIDWRHLMWGMGTGLKQLDMAPLIEPFLKQQLSCGSKAAAAETVTSAVHKADCSKDYPTSTFSLDLPPAYSPQEISGISNLREGELASQA